MTTNRGSHPLRREVVSEILGHSTAAFTMDLHAVVAEELAEAAAVAIAAFVPRRASKPGRIMKMASGIVASVRPGAAFVQVAGRPTEPVDLAIRVAAGVVIPCWLRISPGVLRAL